MNKLLRYWNQNKKKVLIIIGVIVLFYTALQILNFFAKQKNTSNSNNKVDSYIQDNRYPTQSVITGEKPPEKITQNNLNIIEQFVNYCNNKETNKAFLLLTEDCKQEFNNNIELFKTRYYDNIFKTKKTYSLELWYSGSNIYTYKILYYEDNLLATGGAGINNNFEDYITVINNNNESKISINRFIGKKIINKSKMVENIEIIINSKNIYRDYEIYNITIKNHTANTIIVSDGENADDICLLDKNNLEYVSFIEELPEYDLTIKPYRENTVNIEFNKMYDINKDIKKIKFKNINIIDKTNQTVEITIDI